MENIFRNLKYLIIVAIILIIISFNFIIFNPMQQRLESSLKNEFKQQFSIQKNHLENYVEQKTNAVETLSSRTMIRKKLAEYQTGDLSLEELQEYTQPKYNDGAKILDNLVETYRISNQKVIASWRVASKTKLRSYHNSDNKKLQTTIFPEQELLIVDSPIYQSETLLGHDLASFDLSNILNQLNKDDINYSIISGSVAGENLKATENKLKYVQQILDTDYYLKAEILKENLYQPINKFSSIAIVTTVIILLLISLIFKIVIDKTSRQVINELEEKNKKINKSLDYYQGLFNNINSGVAVYQTENEGEDFYFSDINKEGQKIDNVEKENLLGKSVKEVFPEVEEFGLLAVLQRVYQTGEPEKLPFTKYEDDRISAYRENYVYKLSTGEVVAVYRDLTEKQRRRHELEETKNRLQMAIEGANLGLWDWNKRDGEIKFNDKWAEMLGYDLDEIDQNIEEWKKRIHSEDKKRVLTKLNNHLEGKTDYYETEHRLKTKSGDWKWIKDKGQVMERDEDGDVIRVVGIHQDINDRMEAKQKIEYLSFHDELTGLYNRRYFKNEQNRLNDSRRLPITIMIGDLDGLKYINDNYGHQKGDKYIKAVADLFRSVTREEDIVARVGGDEFAVLLPETDENAIENFCDRFYEQLKEFNSKNKLEEELSISLGYAIMKDSEQDLNHIFDLADKNMYKNKNSSRKKPKENQE
ncbi:MAG: sensor domain-containing diguanylate cyclase [Bacillota bacterium]